MNLPKNTLILSLLLITGISGLLIFPAAIANYYTLRAENFLKQSWIDQNSYPCEYPVQIDEEAKSIAHQSIELATKALQFKQEVMRANLIRARAACLLGQPRLAIEDYTAYVDQYPDKILPLIELGFAFDLLARNKFDPPDSPEVDLNMITEFKPALQAWEKAGLSADEFFDQGVQELSGAKKQSSNTWYHRGLLLAGTQFDDFSGLTNKKFAVVESFQNLKRWKACSFCGDTVSSFTVNDDGLGSMAYTNRTGIRDGVGYRFIYNISLSDSEQIIVRLRGSEGTKLTVELVIDGNRVRPINYHDVEHDWSLVTIPIHGDMLYEILIGISENSPNQTEDQYSLDLDWIVIE